MAVTAGPHQSSLANKLDPRVDSSTGTTTAAGSAADTSSRGTGPAPTTAGPHKSDTANKLDPRVDSDLNNQAQYAPGTTTTGDNHPGATQPMSNPESSSSGPHSSNVLNKLDPRVNSKTGETTAKSTNETGTKTPTNSSGVVQGSSTGAPAAPSSQTSTKAGDNAKNAPQTSRGNYNPSTGTGFDPPGGGSKGKGTTAGSSTTSSGGTDIGQGIKAAVAGIHGAGESIRGTFNKAVDSLFNDKDGMAKNEAIAQEGEREVQTGDFAPSTKAREGFKRG